MNPKIIPAFLAFIILLSGCAKDKTNDAAGLPIVIHPKVMTRVGEADFETGDKIGLNVYIPAVTTHADNEEMTHNGQYFISDDLKWYDTGQASVFDAYYPFRTDYDQMIVLDGDQRGDGYSRSDILMSRAENVMPNANGVSLVFFHAMSQVVIGLENNSIYDVSKVTVGNVRGEINIDMEDMMVSTKIFGPVMDVIANKVSEETYRTVIAPQEATLTITIENTIGTETTHTFAFQHFEAGRAYTATIVIDDDFEISDADIITDGDIEQWLDGNELVPEEE